MKSLLSTLVALSCAVLLSSCALVPVDPPDPSESPDTLYVDPEPVMRERMDEIVEAVNQHDAAALKAMFSARAIEQATDLDADIDYFLSLFADGGLTSNWWVEPVAERQYKNGELTELLLVEYNVSAHGHDYSLFFADFTVNEIIDPTNVGLYAIGAIPWPEDHHSWVVEAPSDHPFFLWAESIHADERDEDGYPGVYVPETR